MYILLEKHLLHGGGVDAEAAYAQFPLPFVQRPEECWKLGRLVVRQDKGQFRVDVAV